MRLVIFPLIVLQLRKLKRIGELLPKCQCSSVNLCNGFVYPFDINCMKSTYRVLLIFIFRGLVRRIQGP